MLEELGFSGSDHLLFVSVVVLALGVIASIRLRRISESFPLWLAGAGVCLALRPVLLVLSWNLDSRWTLAEAAVDLGAAVCLSEIALGGLVRHAFLKIRGWLWAPVLLQLAAVGYLFGGGPGIRVALWGGFLPLSGLGAVLVFWSRRQPSTEGIGWLRCSAVSLMALMLVTALEPVPDGLSGRLGAPGWLDGIWLLASLGWSGALSVYTQARLRGRVAPQLQRYRLGLWGVAALVCLAGAPLDTGLCRSTCRQLLGQGRDIVRVFAARAREKILYEISGAARVLSRAPGLNQVLNGGENAAVAAQMNFWRSALHLSGVFLIGRDGLAVLGVPGRAWMDFPNMRTLRPLLDTLPENGLTLLAGGGYCALCPVPGPLRPGVLVLERSFRTLEEDFRVDLPLFLVRTFDGETVATNVPAVRGRLIQEFVREDVQEGGGGESLDVNLFPEGRPARFVWYKDRRRLLTAERVPGGLEMWLLMPAGRIGVMHLFGLFLMLLGIVAGWTAILRLERNTELTLRIRSSERRYRAFFEKSRDAVLIVDPRHGLLLDVNREAERLLGLDRMRLLGLPYSRVFAPEEAHLLTHRAPEADSPPVEMHGVTSTGQHVPLEVIGSAIEMDDGRLVLQYVCRDITERRRNELALRESEEKFRVLFERAPEGVTIVRGGIHLYVNEAYARMFGYEKPAELTGSPLLALRAPEYRARIAEYVAKREHGLEAPLQYEAEGLRRDGSRFPYQVTVSRVVIGGASASIAFFQDITRRRQDEEEMQRTRRQIEMVFSQLPGMLWMTDREMRVTFVMGGVLERLGFDTAHVLGKAMGELLPGVDPDFPLLEAHRKALSGQSVHYEQDWRDDWFEMHLEPLRGHRKVVEGVIGVAFEITQRRRTLDALNRSQEQFATLISEASDGIFVFDAHLVVREANPCAARMMGCPPAQLVGLPVAGLFPPPEAERGMRLIEDLKEG